MPLPTLPLVLAAVLKLDMNMLFSSDEERWCLPKPSIGRGFFSAVAALVLFGKSVVDGATAADDEEDEVVEVGRVATGFDCDGDDLSGSLTTGDTGNWADVVAIVVVICWIY